MLKKLYFISETPLKQSVTSWVLDLKSLHYLSDKEETIGKHNISDLHIKQDLRGVSLINYSFLSIYSPDLPKFCFQCLSNILDKDCIACRKHKILYYMKIFNYFLNIQKLS